MDAHEASWSALVVDDDPGIRQSLRLCLEAAGGRVLGVGTGAAALDALDRAAYDVVLLDLWLGAESGMAIVGDILARQPGIGIVVITAFASFETAVEAMKKGAADYLPKPFTPEQVRLAVKRVLDSRQLHSRVSELETRLAGVDAGALLESRSPAFRAFVEAARRAAGSDAPVLLRGEGGTGKDVLARWIHAQSARRDRPFVAVNCPMLPADQIAGVVFGAKQAAGKVHDAEGGTLMLDELGDLGGDAQARLLRLLAERSYERLGESRERHADLRIIATTTRPPDELVAAGRLREDLRFRLDVLTLAIPPLRERAEDIPALAEHFLGFYAARAGRPDVRFSPAAHAAMAAHRWPGNVRELRNLIERAVILGAATVIEPADLGLDAGGGAVQLGSLASLDDLEREHIARVIAKTATLEAAARVLGIDATTLSRKRKRYGLA
jgi:two-component system, NtrC family, response regulator AlgB